MSEETDQELDAQIAERLMGEIRPLPPADCDDPISITWIGTAWLHTHEFDRGDVCEVEPRQFSSDISAAMEVVEKIREQGLGILICDGDTRKWEVEIDNGEIEIAAARDNALPRAICLAALKAIETK